MKKIFSLFAAVMMVATMFAGRTFSATDTLYMDCSAVGWWCNDGVSQTMYFVNASEQTTSVVGIEYGKTGSKIYAFACPVGTFEYIYEQRGTWNKTGNISLTGTEGKNYIKSFSENSTIANWGNYGDAPDPEITRYLYVTDNCTSWENLYVYAWGGKEVFGGWPGTNVRTAEQVEGAYKLAMTARENAEIHLIFNIGSDSAQFDSDIFNLTADYYVIASDSPTAIKNVEQAAKVVKIMENGQLVIIKDGVRYNAVGAQL